MVSLVSSSYNTYMDKKPKQMAQNIARQQPSKANRLQASVSIAVKQLVRNICAATTDTYLFTA